MRLLSMAASAMLVTFVCAANEPATKVKAPKWKNKTNFIYSDQDGEHPDWNNTEKVMIQGGMYTTNRVDRIHDPHAIKPVSETWQAAFIICNNINNDNIF